MSVGAQVTLTITFNSEDASFANSMGWYNSRTGQAGILFLDFNDDGKHAEIHSGATRTLTVLQSDLDAGKIGFFLIPDGSDEYKDSLLSAPMRFVVGSNGDGRIVIDPPHGSDVVLNGTNGDVLFSDRKYNAGDYDYVSGTVGTDGQTKAQKFGQQSDGPDGILGVMAWDDQVVQSGNKGSDRDFNDAVFTVKVNSAPTSISLDNFSVVEETAGAVIGNVSGVDPDGDALKFTVSDARFEIVDGVLKLKAPQSIDFEAEPTITLTIKAEDPSHASFSKSFTIDTIDLPAGLAIDGYIASATVFADANQNGVLDAGEAFATTDAFGKFELDSGGATLIMTGGFDIATGLATQGSLKAAAGSTCVTPLTTLVMDLEGDGSMLAVLLGLPSNTDFGALDPIAAAGGNPMVFAGSSQFLNTATMIAAIISGSSFDQLTQDQAMAAAFATLAARIADGTINQQIDVTLNLDDAGVIETLIYDTAEAAGLAVDAGLVSDTALVIADSNSKVDDITMNAVTTDQLLTEITAASIVAQGQTTAAIDNAAGGGPNSLVGDYTGGALDTLVAAAESQVGNTTGTGTAGNGAGNTVTLTDDPDTYDGAGGNDVITGKGGNDLLLGGDGNDKISGDDGNDVLYGQDGVDTLAGGADDDRLFGGAGNDSLDGGAGNDTYYHSGIAAIDGHDTIASGITGVDRIVFTTPNLYDMTPTRVGNDLIVGPIFNDPLNNFPYDGTVTVKNFYSSAATKIFVEIDAAYNEDYGTDPNLSTFAITRDIANGENNATYSEQLLGGDGDDTIHANDGYFDRAVGGLGNDTIYGEGGRDALRGDDGNDTLFGGAGSDRLRGGKGDDILDGGTERDRAIFDEATQGVVLDLTNIVAGYAVTVNDGTGGIDRLKDVEDLRGGSFDDKLSGDSNDNFLQGADGNDQLNGAGGNDNIEGGNNNDTINGGAGDDYLIGGVGTDKLDGGDDYDTVSFAFGANHGVNINFATGVVSDDGFGDTDTVANFEQVDGSQYGDTITGGANQDNLFANGGDDTVDGGGENDRIDGGEGDDTLVGGAGDDGLSGAIGNDNLSGGIGEDFLDGGEDNDTLLGGADHDVIDGGIGNDFLDGGTGNDDLFGGDGDDTIAGGQGFDGLSGGAGADVFKFAVANFADADIVVDYTYSDGDKVDLSELLDGDVVNIGNVAGYLQVQAGDSFIDIGVDTDGGGDNFQRVVLQLFGAQDVGKVDIAIDNDIYHYDKGTITGGP